jgi:hypothetical protein
VLHSDTKAAISNELVCLIHWSARTVLLS